ncbi:MAG: Acg family FMN-binding oxidoreductase [Pseudomonadota bacterium]
MDRRTLLIGGGLAGGIVIGGAAASFATMGSDVDYAAYADDLRRPMAAPPDLAEAVRYATLAPNGHNTQPWRFRIGDGGIAVQPDFARRTPVVDPDDHHLYVSLGCAAENLSLALRAMGRDGGLSEIADRAGGIVAATGAVAPHTDPLFDAIAKRQSTRADYDGSTVAPADLEQLVRAAAVPGVRMVLLTERSVLNRARDLIVAGNDAQMADAAFVAELKHWMRFNPAMAMAHGDGLFTGCTGNPSMPGWIAPAMLRLFFTAAGERAKYVRQIDTSSGLAVFFGDRADPRHWIQVGRACQRFALAATRLGLRQSFVNQPVEVASLRADFAALAGEPGLRPDLVLRFGRGAALPFSPRRPVRAVLG